MERQRGRERENGEKAVYGQTPGKREFHYFWPLDRRQIRGEGVAGEDERNIVDERLDLLGGGGVRAKLAEFGF